MWTSQNNCEGFCWNRLIYWRNIGSSDIQNISNEKINNICSVSDKRSMVTSQLFFGSWPDFDRIALINWDVLGSMLLKQFINISNEIRYTDDLCLVACFWSIKGCYSAHSVAKARVRQSLDISFGQQKVSLQRHINLALLNAFLNRGSLLSCFGVIGAAGIIKGCYIAHSVAKARVRQGLDISLRS